jgi:hypothetical protein
MPRTPYRWDRNPVGGHVAKRALPTGFRSHSPFFTRWKSYPGSILPAGRFNSVGNRFFGATPSPVRQRPSLIAQNQFTL